MRQVLTATIKPKQQMSAKIVANQSLSGRLATNPTGKYPDYQGEMEFTPSEEEQIIPTENKSVLGNIIINPIPNNYGKITWNGAVLTVS